MKLKKNCCEKYRRRAEACRRCPVMAVLGDKQGRRRLKKIRKELAHAA